MIGQFLLTRRRRVCAAFLSVSMISAAPALAQEAQRSVIPIRETVIRPVGTPRYSVTLLVNGVPIETGLDTGSVGLRILPRGTRRAGITPGPQPSSYSYGNGVQLDGHQAMATIQIGATRGAVALQAIGQVSCVSGRQCPAAGQSPEAYGLMGSGEPHQGFVAIMGTRLNGGNIPNPLIALGIRRWIVHLPQRGGGGGALILNPDARDLAGFIPLRAGKEVPGSVAGCAMIARPEARRLCGPTLLDTGAPGLTIHNGPRPPGWQRGIPARLEFFGADGVASPGVGFQTGDTAVGATTDFTAQARESVSIKAGTLPFYAYDVLFDHVRGGIAVRPNGSASDEARPIVGNPQAGVRSW